ncbi:unnamed protein product [Cunninghamella blakesleeana]
MSHNAVSTLHPTNGTPSTPTPQPHQHHNVENDRQRLQETYDKYLKRIQYLTTLRANTDIIHDTVDSKKDEKIKVTKNSTIGNQQIPAPTRQQQNKGQYSKWVRKIASSSSLDSKTSRLEIDIHSSNNNVNNNNSSNNNSRYGSRSSGGSVNTTTTTGSPRWQNNHYAPSSPPSYPLDAPPSPVSSKSTPSRPTSNRKSNDTLNNSSDPPPPPLEPRSVYRPNPRKSSRSGAAAALQQQQQFDASSSPPLPPVQSIPVNHISTSPQQQYHDDDHHDHPYQRKASLSSISSSSSSEGSDNIGGPNSQQPSMALPSLLATKMEVSSASSVQMDQQNNLNNRNSNNSNHDKNNNLNENIINENANNQNEMKQSPLKLSTSPINHEENNNNFNNNVLGRLRTSSLPKKLPFSRTNSGSSSTSRQRQRSESNDATPTSSTTSSVPMRRNVTQPSITMPNILSDYHQDTITTPSSATPSSTNNSLRSSTVQRQSSGLSMRKKYNRQSRTSMEKEKLSGPIFSNFFGNVGGSHNGIITKDFNAFSPSSRSSDDTLDYFGREINNYQQQQNAFYDSDSTTNSSLPDNQQQQSNPVNKNLETHLKLIMALENSMNYGGYITPSLFIPKNLWHHNNIRLPSMDVKVAACESLILDLNRIEKWKNLDDIRGSLRLIESLEEVVDGLQITLSKKLKRDSLVDSTDDNISIIHSPDGSSLFSNSSNNISTIGIGSNGSIASTGSSGSSTVSNGSGSLNKRTQFMSWGSKLSKSVERMNAFSLTKVEDQHRHYIEVLQKLFIKLHLLEMWFQHYLKKDRQKNPHYDTLLSKLGKVCEGINRVVGGFVLRDVAILLGKWLKRGSTWVNE